MARGVRGREPAGDLAGVIEGAIRRQLATAQAVPEIKATVRSSKSPAYRLTLGR